MQTSKAAFLWEKGKSTTKKKDILKFYEVIFKNKCQIIWYKSQTPSFLRSGYIILAWSDNAAKGISQPFLHLPLGPQWLGGSLQESGADWTKHSSFGKNSSLPWPYALMNTLA